MTALCILVGLATSLVGVALMVSVAILGGVIATSWFEVDSELPAGLLRFCMTVAFVITMCGALLVDRAVLG